MEISAGTGCCHVFVKFLYPVSIKGSFDILGNRCHFILNGIPSQMYTKNRLSRKIDLTFYLSHYRLDPQQNYLTENPWRSAMLKDNFEQFINKVYILPFLFIYLIFIGSRNPGYWHRYGGLTSLAQATFTPVLVKWTGQ